VSRGEPSQPVATTQQDERGDREADLHDDRHDETARRGEAGVGHVHAVEAGDRRRRRDDGGPRGDLAHVGVLLQLDAGVVAPAEVRQQFAVSAHLSVDHEDMIEHILEPSGRLAIHAASGAGAEVTQRLDQRLHGMRHGQQPTGDLVQDVRFVRGRIAEQAFGRVQERPLDPARDRGQIVDDDRRDGVEDVHGAGLFHRQPLEALSRPLQRVTVLLADGDHECVTDEHHDPTDLERRRRVR
jgi:hypothetical protein